MQMTINYRVVLGIVGAALALASVFVFGWVTPVDAAGPKEGLETEELNVDADGYIAVHEQGIADVNVVGGEATVVVDDTEPLDVEITNVPTVDVDDATDAVLAEIRDLVATVADNTGSSSATEVTENRSLSLKIPGTRFWTFSPILATHITFSSENDDVVFRAFNDSVEILELGNPQDQFPVVLSIPFTVPVRMDSIFIICANSTQDCEIDISILGLPVGS